MLTLGSGRGGGRGTGTVVWASLRVPRALRRGLSEGVASSSLGGFCAGLCMGCVIDIYAFWSYCMSRRRDDLALKWQSYEYASVALYLSARAWAATRVLGM